MLLRQGIAMRRENQRPGPKDLISAQEIACFVYFPEQWRLQSGLGLGPANRESLAAGDRHQAGRRWLSV
jgi:putative heme iron utilization protein